MTMLLLDAGVWVAATDPDQKFYSEAGALLESAEPVAALDLTLFEVANAVGVVGKKPDRARWMLDAMTVRCRERIVRADPSLMVAAVDHALPHGLSIYDAAYVAVARRNDWTLVSTDFRDLVSKGLAVAPDAAV